MNWIRMALLLTAIGSILASSGCPLVEDTREPDGGADTR